MWNLLNRIARRRGGRAIAATCSGSAAAVTPPRPVLVSRGRRIQQQPPEAVKWALLVIPVGSFGLGAWQLRRRRWKLDLIQTLQQKTTSPPIGLPNDITELDNMEYCPVKVRGRFLHDKEILIGPRALIDNEAMSRRAGSLVSDPNRNQGWLVITPFVLSDSGKVILVNRGWVHQKMKSKEQRTACLINTEVELTGIVRLTEPRPPFVSKNKPEKNQWFTRDLQAMSEAVGCLPVWLDARGLSDPPPGWPIPNQTRVTMRNEHFSYIVTWFSMSALTSVMWFRLFVKKLPLL